MIQADVAEIELAERDLRDAVLASDVGALDALLAPDLVFTDHAGVVIGKEEDLALHRSGRLRIHAMEPSERRIRRYGASAVVSVRMRVCGAFDGQSIDLGMRYTRVWVLDASDRWTVAAAHASAEPG